jgi:hypothetical protein
MLQSKAQLNNKLQLLLKPKASAMNFREPFTSLCY